MKKNKNLIIAIDGPAASGKSTTARLVAQELGYLYIDSGAMYRALTLEVLNRNISIEDEEQVVRVAREVDICLSVDGNKIQTLLNGLDVSEEIRLPRVTRVISIVSAYREVRAIMKQKQRDLAHDGGVVMDGRDIGTVVLPNAQVKVFMNASVEKRTDRRVKELQAKGVIVDRETIRIEIIQRDEIDSNREFAPLKPATDAHIINTSDLSIDQQVQAVLNLIGNLAL
jgi:cytidylate kinase